MADKEQKDQDQPQWLKATSDVTVQHALRSLGEGGTMADGTQLYEVESVPLSQGDYIPYSWLAPHQQDAFDNGRLTQLVAVDDDEAEGALRELERAGRFSTFVPEHSVEREAMAAYGHDIIEREEALELASAGAEAAAEAQERAYAEAGPVATRPGLTEMNAPDLAELSREGKSALPRRKGVAPVDVEDVEGSVQVTPSGVIGGPGRAAAEQHPDAAAEERIEANKAAAKERGGDAPAAKKSASRSRPAAKKDD